MRPTRLPSDAHQRGDAGLVHPLSEKSDDVLEVAGEAHGVFGPRNKFGRHAAPVAVDAVKPIPESHLDAGKIQVPPGSGAGVVDAPSPAAATGAARHARRRRDVDDQSCFADFESRDARLLDAEHRAQ